MRGHLNPVDRCQGIQRLHRARHLADGVFTCIHTVIGKLLQTIAFSTDFEGRIHTGRFGLQHQALARVILQHGGADIGLGSVDLGGDFCQRIIGLGNDNAKARLFALYGIGRQS